MRFRIAIAVLTVLLFSVNNGVCQESAPALKDNTFVMAFNRSGTQHSGKLRRLIYTEVFKRLGIKAEFREYPSKRASIEAESGNIDGEAIRPRQYGAEHPNLIRVEESLFPMNLSAFTANDSIPPMKGWESFKGTNYRVEYRRGLIVCEHNLSKFVSKENLSDVTEPEQGLKKLISGRTDLFIYDEEWVRTALNTPEFKDSKIRFVGLIESLDVYPYLHKKHASLVPKMAEIIKAMKAEGLIEQYRMAVDKEFGVVRK
jgi:polar amino acid transport system substrate-binding protein